MTSNKMRLLDENGTWVEGLVCMTYALKFRI